MIESCFGGCLGGPINLLGNLVKFLFPFCDKIVKRARCFTHKNILLLCMTKGPMPFTVCPSKVVWFSSILAV